MDLLKANYVLNGRSSLKTATHQLKPLLALLGDAEAATVKNGRIEAYKATRVSAGAAPATVNNELTLLHRAYVLAQHQELVQTVPYIEKLPCHNARSGFVRPEEFHTITRTLDVLDPPVSDVVRWLYGLGWRREEALGLTWPEISLAEGTVSLPAARSKNRTPRRVALGADLKEMIERRKGLESGLYVFHRKGKPIKTFRGSWERASEALGRPGLLPHDLRRSFARNGLAAGLPVKLIMEIGGWKTLSVFFRYCIIDEAAMAEGVQKVAEFVRAAK